MYKDMNKPLTGIPLILFRAWLYAPLLFIVYVDYQTIVSLGNVSWLGVLIAILGSIFIFVAVLFSKDFREFSRATSWRIIFFFGISFAVTELFIVVLNALYGDLRLTWSLAIIPSIFGVIFTPALVMRLDILMPDNETVPPKPIEDPGLIFTPEMVLRPDIHMTDSPTIPAEPIEGPER